MKKSEINYQEYLASDHWKEMKRRYKKDACEICGSTTCLELNHLTYNKLGNERKKDFMTLCRWCHGASHLTASGRHKGVGNIHVKHIVKKKEVKRNILSAFLWRRYWVMYGKDKRVTKGLLSKYISKYKIENAPFLWINSYMLEVWQLMSNRP